MAYTMAILNAHAADVQAANIFPAGRWRRIAFQRLIWRSCFLSTWVSILTFGLFFNPGLLTSVLLLSYIYRRLPATSRLRAFGETIVDKYGTVVGLTYLWLNRKATNLSWSLYFTIGYDKAFEQDYIEAWRVRLASLGDTTAVYGFLGLQSLPMPVLFDPHDNAIGNDRATLEMLRMCFSLLQAERGFTELLLPRNLTRVDRVNILQGTTNALGSRINALDLGRGDNNNVIDLERPARLPADQRTLTRIILEDPANIGIEFVRVRDTSAVTAISLSPFVASMLFIAIWMGLFIGKFGGDVQVVTQTAFTGAAYIVTAGALFIALFAYLDSQSNQGR
ncbi:hypothetical protein LTR86_006964 [Recurvomyces mirabilis]|nr:hypothetical protein LTR86_006964 [Recurvomyces mirabilis]